jgi:hypothetical protein
MAEKNPLGLHTPDEVAKVWGTALVQLVNLWRTAATAGMALGSGEQPVVQSNQSGVPSADGRMPHLRVRNLVGETFHKQLDPQAVVFKQIGSGPGSVTVESSIDPTFQPVKDGNFQPITGDTYTGEVVDENGRVVGTVRLEAGG